MFRRRDPVPETCNRLPGCNGFWRMVRAKSNKVNQFLWYQGPGTEKIRPTFPTVASYKGGTSGKYGIGFPLACWKPFRF
jgi:hypothetical protein